MNYRIITHGQCTDGYCSAFVFKKYWRYLAPELKQQDIDHAPIMPFQPRDVQSGEYIFQKKDIVLDLPLPSNDVFFWADHHTTNKPPELKKNHFWNDTPSCAGFLLDLAQHHGLHLTEELQQFKKASETMDSASYTKTEIKECYYPTKKEETSSPLLKMHMISAMFSTKDGILNDAIFKTLLGKKLSATPFTTKSLWQLNPSMFFEAQLQGLQKWRDQVDTYIEYNEKARCVVQDDRKIGFSRGVPDRFYSYLKFPDAIYNLVLKVVDEKTTRIGIGSNIFHKDWCTVDIGKLCQHVGRTFHGVGGGHFHVGGATIAVEQTDKAKEMILSALTQR